MSKFTDIIEARGVAGDLSDEVRDLIRRREVEHSGVDIERYQKMTDDEKEAFMASRQAKHNERKKIVAAVETIVNAVNGGRIEDVAETVALAVMGTHRTLQQEFISVILHMLSLYRGAAYDARNVEAVAVCEMITAMLDWEGIKRLSLV